jgi:hypothetical protein
MRNNLIILFFFLQAGVLLGQSAAKSSWTDLMDITFKDVYLESDDMYGYYPLLKEKQKQLDGQRIAITGYIIPIDVEQNQYVLSAFPFSACFFCGNAGPESVMAIYFKSNDRTFATDERLTLEGQLHLNDTDVDELIYVLKDAVVAD